MGTETEPGGGEPVWSCIKGVRVFGPERWSGAVKVKESLIRQRERERRERDRQGGKGRREIPEREQDRKVRQRASEKQRQKEEGGQTDRHEERKGQEGKRKRQKKTGRDEDVVRHGLVGAAWSHHIPPSQPRVLTLLRPRKRPLVSLSGILLLPRTCPHLSCAPPLPCF